MEIAGYEISIMQLIFLIAVGLALIDTFSEILFGGVGILGDFSLVGFLINLAYILGSLILWIILLLESLVFLDFITPLTVLLQIVLMLAGLLGQNITDLLFDLMKFPFSFISFLFSLAGINSLQTIEGSGQLIGVDFESMTFLIGININIVGNGFQGSAFFTVFGFAGGEISGYTFTQSGALGFALRLRAVVYVLNKPIESIVPVVFSLEEFITNFFELIKFDYSPQDVFEQILDTIQELGKRLI